MLNTCMTILRKVFSVCRWLLRSIVESVAVYVITFSVFAAILLCKSELVASAIEVFWWGIVVVVLYVCIRTITKRGVRKRRHSILSAMPFNIQVVLMVVEIVLFLGCIYVTYIHNAASYTDLELTVTTSLGKDDEDIEGVICMFRAVPVFIHKPITSYYTSAFAYMMERQIDEEMALTLAVRTLSQAEQEAKVQGAVTVCLWLLYGVVRYFYLLLSQYRRLLSRVTAFNRSAADGF